MPPPVARFGRKGLKPKLNTRTVREVHLLALPQPDARLGRVLCPDHSPSEFWRV